GGLELARCALRESLVVFAASAIESGAPRIVADARGARVVVAPGAGRGGVAQRDAVDGAGRHAQVATGAQRVDHRVHAARGTDDRIDRAGLDAPGAADAAARVDPRRAARLFAAAGRIEGQHVTSEQVRQAPDALDAAGRAAVDRRLAAGNRFGVGAAAGEAALRALRLGQQCIDRIDRGHATTRSFARWRFAAMKSRTSG